MGVVNSMPQMLYFRRDNTEINNNDSRYGNILLFIKLTAHNTIAKFYSAPYRGKSSFRTTKVNITSSQLLTTNYFNINNND
jgi:hypothetical protein